MKIPYPTFEQEKEALNSFDLVVGIDEVGVGALAGPVYCGFVVFKPDDIKSTSEHILNLGIHDSKLLSSTKREQLAEQLTRFALYTSVNSSTVSEINTLGIRKATQKAIRRGVSQIRKQCGQKSLFLLLDEFTCPRVRALKKSSQKGIIHGDRLSISIAVASIIAKVERDRKMREYATKYPLYGWEKNVGYGTRAHIQAIKEYGPIDLHRTLYIRSIVKE